jgi:tetratricopeptide (TPR) repeat protein
MALSKANDELVIAPEEKYQALLRSLRRTKDFGILFIQCSPAEASRLITKVKKDIPQKKIEPLILKESVDNLYEIIERRSDRDELNILFIQGIEKSLEAYIKPGYGGQGDYYKLDTVPPILNHLNQQRENFRDHFSNICFVFIVPLFALKYFIHRAPDFFDWRSGVFSFPMDSKLVEEESLRVLSSRNFREDQKLDPQQRQQQLLEIEQLIEEENQTPTFRSELLCEQGQIFHNDQEYEIAVASYDKALEIQPDQYRTWDFRGDTLRELKRYEEAIASYDKALEIQPDHSSAWSSRGHALIKLERYEEAIASYDKALEIQPNHYWDWILRGSVLIELERYEEAIASYDKALEIQPNHYSDWVFRGNVLIKLERYEGAVASYDKALEIQPDCSSAWSSRGYALVELERYEEAIASYDKALEIQPDRYVTWVFRGNVLIKLERYEEAIDSYDKALEIQPNHYSDWAFRGNVLIKLERYEEAVASYDKALEIQPDDDEILASRDEALSKLERLEAITSK